MGRPLLAAVGMILLSACAGSRARPTTFASTPETVQIENVPFFSDDTDQCGPATLASILTFWDKPTTPQALRAEIYLPNINGTLPMDLLPAVEARGLRALVSNGSVEELQENLRAGRPVLAYVDYGIANVAWGHYVVVTGFDKRGVYAHSSKKAHVFISYGKLENVWGRTDRWMLVVSGPVDGGEAL